MTTITRWIDELSSPELGTRLHAEAQLIGAGHEAIAPLTALIQQPGVPAEARFRACCALGDLGATTAIDALIASLKDESWDVRHSAAYALGHMRDARGFDALEGLLFSGYKDEQIPYVAAIGLIQVDAERGRAALERAANDANPVIHSIARSALIGLRFL